MKNWQSWLLALSLLWSAGAGLYLAHSWSMTTDEGVHIASGYLAITRQDFRFDPEHPFVFKALTALPVVFLHPNLPPNDQKLWQAAAPITYDSWQQSREWSEQWFFKSNNPAELMLFLARIPGILALLALVYLIFLLGKSWFSPSVGALAAFFAAFNPTLLAHGSLANDDIALAAAVLWTLYLLWRYLEKPSWKGLAWVALAVTLALLTKYSAIYLVAIIPLLFIYRWAIGRSLPLRHFIGLTFSVWALIWIAYLGHVSSEIRWWGIFRYMLPSDYIKGFILVVFSTTAGRPTYLLGELHRTGIWYYFPVLLLLKTQLAGLLCLVAGVITAWYGRQPKNQMARAVLVITLLVIGILSITSKLNIGLRHIAPLLALFALFMAIGALWLSQRQKWLLPIFLILYTLPVLWELPTLIGFSNISVLPKSQTYAYFNDSNLDWGYQAGQIADYLRRTYPGQPLYINYNWSPYILGYYGLQTVAFNPSQPPHGVVLGLTATELTYTEYSQFKKIAPLTTLAGGTFFYRLP